MSNKDIVCYGGEKFILQDFINRISGAKFFLNNAYNLKVPPSWRIERFRQNTDMHLILVTSGRGQYFLGAEERVVELRKGVLIFVGTGMAHSSCADRYNPPSVIPLRFGVCNLTGQQSEIKQNFAVILNNVRLDIFTPLFTRLWTIHQGLPGAEKDGLLTNGIFRTIFGEISVALNEDSTNNRIRPAMDKINSTLEQKISIKELAYICGISEKHFIRLFKKYSGLTPAHYHRQRRIEKACYHLDNTLMNIGEIAEILGYPDQFSFSKQFKEITGIPPSKYRNK